MSFGHGHFISDHVVILGILLVMITLLDNLSEAKIANEVERFRRFDEPYYPCNFFKGKWVFDDSYPLYDPKSCPFIDKGFDCLKNGRPDQMYLKHRWRPQRCDLARFNGLRFLQKYSGKRIMFVGDSLSLNQWQSLTCMLHAAVPYSNYTLERKKPLSVLTFPEYKVSIMFMWTAFLVDLVKEERGSVLKLDSINGGNAWKEVDMLIFNTWHWWTHKGHKQGWDYIQVGNKEYTAMDRLDAFKIALSTWGKWVDSNIVPWKTQVFFQGISPVHYNGSEWNEPNAYKCNAQTRPVEGNGYSGLGGNSAADVVKEVLRGMSTPIYLLDITMLSQLRVDGHPSVYSSVDHKGMDCSHWCLAGVPDTRNQLLYSILLD